LLILDCCFDELKNSCVSLIDFCMYYNFSLNSFLIKSDNDL
jgi:hypothetical protein